jgi:hypothetical protein
MATTTPNYGWPVPTSTDYVKDGATAIEALGDAIDATVFGLPSAGLTLVKTQVIGSAVSSVNVTSAFSTTYDAYKIVISGGVASTVVNLGLKLGASAASYSYITTGVNSVGSAATSRVTSGASFLLAGSGNADTLNLNLDIVNPFLAKYSLVNSSFADDNTTGYVMLGTHKVATSYTDFTLTPSSGTLTGGTIRVYGYKN